MTACTLTAPATQAMAIMSDIETRIVMSRIEWTRRTPEEIEAVLGIMLCRENPSAQRVRPAQGDHGIDVYVPEEDAWAVYQVKSFTEAMTSSHKRQITNSWNEFSKFVKERSLKIAAWYVLRPLNPTIPEIDWLKELTEGADFPCEWRGLDFCEGLASDYPAVVDYYLFDGKERLSETIKALLAVTGWVTGAGDDVLAPSEAYPTLEALHAALNEFDPHYYFDFSVDTVPEGSKLPKIPEAPGLVAATTRRSGERAVTFRIFARFEEATNERPVPGSFTIKVKPGSPEADAWEDFIAYGTPAEDLPVSGISVDLPGGLGGGPRDGGLIRVGPARLDGAKPFDLTVALIDGQSNVLATTTVQMAPATVGLDGKGLAADGTEIAGVFDLSVRIRADGGTSGLSIHPNDITGCVPADVIPGLTMLGAFTPENRLVMSMRNGPSLGEAMQIPGDMLDAAEMALVLEVCQALATIQRHTLTPIRVPDLAESTTSDAREWVNAARLLDGETIKHTWNDATIGFDGDAVMPADLPELAELTYVCAMIVTINGRDIPLGEKLFRYASARPVEVDEERHIIRFEPGDDASVFVSSA